MKLLTAFYDFASSPVSYDFLKFLAGVAAVKQGEGFDHVHVVFVPAETPTGFRLDMKPTQTDNKIWRRDNLLVPLCKLINATHTIAWSRPMAAAMRTEHIYPAGWNPADRPAAYWFSKVRDVINKYGLAPLHVDPEAKKFVQCAGSDYITITIRETYTPVLNSNRKEWERFEAWFGGKFDPQQGRLIWIPDTEHALKGEHDKIGTAAALNPLIRHALYAGAKMNLGVGGGTQALCWFGGLPFLSFHMLKDWFNGTPEFYERWGLPVGKQMPWATDKQRIVWEGSDTFDNIRKHYLDIMQIAEPIKAMA